jgi:hypothetical protein
LQTGRIEGEGTQRPWLTWSIWSIHFISRPRVETTWLFLKMSVGKACILWYIFLVKKQKNEQHREPSFILCDILTLFFLFFWLLCF